MTSLKSKLHALGYGKTPTPLKNDGNFGNLETASNIYNLSISNSFQSPETLETEPASEQIAVSMVSRRLPTMETYNYLIYNEFQKFPKFPEKNRRGGASERARAATATEGTLSSLPSITAFEEHAAILEYDGGLTRQQAERGAAVALGYETPAAFYSAVIAYWRACINRADLPEHFPRRSWFDQLHRASASFLAGGEALEALKAGWCELALFGAFQGRLEAARARIGAQGIVTMLGWSALGVRLIDLDRHGATLRTKTGAELHRPKHQSEINLSAPWWLLRFEEERPNA